MSVKMIVSANYKDREAPEKWLFRKKDQPPKNAVACKCLKAIGVVFKDSSDREQGFGCTKVAFCESVESYATIPDNMSDTSNLFGIGFNENQGGYFFDKKTGLELTEVPVLYLYPDGKMFTNVNVHKKV